MRVERAELVTVELPLVLPFRTAYGQSLVERKLLVRVTTDRGEGWGECAAQGEPLYLSEYLDGAREVIATFLLPRLGAVEVTPPAVAAVLAPVRGHRMAKAALEMAVLDAWGRAEARSLASLLGATRSRVPAGVALGIASSIPELLDAVGRYVEEGYSRIKLKIEPGWDVEPVRAVRERFGDELLLQVDGNGSYRPRDTNRLRELDAFELLLIEQPLPEDDLLGHAELARRLRTPICLDESITSCAGTELALALRACSVINIKPGRVGGLLEAQRIHDLALAHRVPAWIGGMLETGVGRAANVALAALPGFTLPGDLSASRRFYARDLTTPFTLDDGHLTVPTGPGLGVEIDPDVLADVLVDRQEWRRP